MKLTTKIIADKIIEVTGLDIRSRSRNPKIVQSRWVYTKLCKSFLNDSLTNIGREVNLNHATVIHNLKNIDNPYKFDLNCQNLFNNLSSEIIREFKIVAPKEIKTDSIDIHNTKEIERLKGRLNLLIKDFTKLSIKSDNQKETIKELRKSNTELIEKNFKLSLNI